MSERANWSLTFGLWIRRLVCACIGHKWNIPWDAWESEAVRGFPLTFKDCAQCDRCGEKVTP